MGNRVRMWYMLPKPWINWVRCILNRHSDSVLARVPADREGVDRRPWMISVTVVLSSDISPGYIQSHEHNYGHHCHSSWFPVYFPMYCLFASEVAAFIGVNRYTSVDTTFAQVWERTFPEMFQNCLQLAEQRHGGPLHPPDVRAATAIAVVDARRSEVVVKTLRTAVRTLGPSAIRSSMKRILVDDPLLKEMPEGEKRRRLTECTRKYQETTESVIAAAVESMPDAVAQEAKIILQTERDPVDAITALERIGVQGITERVVTQVASTLVPTIQESIDAAVDGQTASCVAAMETVIGKDDQSTCKEVRSAVHTGLGTRQECASLDKFEARTGRPVTARNARGYRKYTTCGEGCRVVICGRVDGLQGDDHVIEAKQRQGRLFGWLVEREKVQLYTYLYLTGRTKGTLVETFGGKQAEHHVEFDPDQWESYLERVHRGVRYLHEILHATDDSERVALLYRVRMVENVTPRG